MKNLFFVFDVESVGLHGEAFAVAGGVYDNGHSLWEFSIACPVSECSGTDEDRQWVKDNIPGMKITHPKPKAMRDEFWRLWTIAKSDGALAAADCGWPVEHGLFKSCISDDPSRKWIGPYPLHEIASFLSASGLDPLATYSRMQNELPEHNPLCDARQSARMLATAIARLSL